MLSELLDCCTGVAGVGGPCTRSKTTSRFCGSESPLTSWICCCEGPGRLLPGSTSSMTHAGGVVPSSMHRRRYAAVSTRTGSCAGRVLGAARMSSARLEPPSVAPLSGGLDVEALVGWTAPSAPAASCSSCSGSGSSSSPSLGSSSSGAEGVSWRGRCGIAGRRSFASFPAAFLRASTRAWRASTRAWHFFPPQWSPI